MREETWCHHMGYSFRLAAMVLLYASSHRQDNTHYSLYYTSRGALTGTRPINGVFVIIIFIYMPVSSNSQSSFHAEVLLDICFNQDLDAWPSGRGAVVWALVHRPWYVLPCLWDGAFKQFPAANQKEKLM